MELRNVLVVEDEYLVAMDIERVLIADGSTGVHLVTSLADAANFIANNPAPDCVLLDVSLPGGTSFDFAASLLAQGIPFGFVSGYSDTAGFPEAFRHAPFLGKPFDDRELSEFVDALVSSVIMPAENDSVKAGNPLL